MFNDSSGYKQGLLITALLSIATMAFGQTKIIAHRGFWDTPQSAQNSLASLSKAHEIGAWGSEFDVHLTQDGIAVVSHDDSIQGFLIEESSYSQLRDLILVNGEKIPTLEQYLAQGKKNKDTKLILEIKPHKTTAMETRAVAQVLELVKKYKVAGQTEYISFSAHICKELVRQAPSVPVAYLKSDLPPKELKAMGCTGMDYHYKAMQLHPEWIKEAHDLGLTVNVWTVNDPDVMQSLVDQGVDFITTDKPVDMAGMIKQ